MVFFTVICTKVIYLSTKKGNIIPVDFGIMGRLDKSNRKFLAEILYGFIQRDYVKVAEVHFQGWTRATRCFQRRICSSAEISG